MDQLLKQDLISDAADIFQLEVGDLKPLERFAKKSANNVVDAIEASKEVELSRFLTALGIKFVGTETASLLARWLTSNFNNIEEPTQLWEVFKKLDQDDLIEIKDIGPKVAAQVEDYFNEERNHELLVEFEKAGIVLIPPEINENQPLEGETYVFTGSLDSLTRSEAKDKVRDLGANPTSSVSKDTGYLVLGSNPGSKLERAKKLGVGILEEEQFLKKISN